MTRAWLLFAVVIVLAAVPAPAQQGSSELFVGPSTGWQTPLRLPVDVAWDAAQRKLYARSLILAEVGDAVDLRIRRAPGTYPDGPVTGTSPAGDVPGAIRWDALTTDGVWRETCGIMGVLGNESGPPPSPGSHPGWLTFYTYSAHHDESLRRVLIDDTGAMALGGGGYGSEGLPQPSYGLHLFGGGLRVQAVPPPGELRAQVVGAAGSRRYTYQVVARDSKGHETPAGQAVTVAGPDRLDGDNFVRLQWDRCPGAESYWVLRDGRRLDVAFYAEGNVKTFEDKGYPAQPYAGVERNPTGDAAVDGSLAVGQALYTPGVCRVRAAGGVAHNYHPAGLDGAATLALAPAAALTLTGLQAPLGDGRWLLLLNAGPAAVTLADSSPSSVPANRIVTGRGKPFVLRKDQVVQLVYLSDRWRVIQGGCDVVERWSGGVGGASRR